MTVKQRLQQIDNTSAQIAWQATLNKLNDGRYQISEDKKLRSCKATYNYLINAKTGEIEGAILTSYSTPVALIKIQGSYRTEYDVLRWVYGYTATSCQHISKFFKDVLPGFAKDHTVRIVYR